MGIVETGELRGESALTPEFRVSFPYVTTGQDKEQIKNGVVEKVTKYSVTMLFPKGADLKVLLELERKVMTDKFGADQTKWPKIRRPFRNQGEKAQKYNGYEEGAIFCTATSKQKPGLLNVTGKRITEPSEFYAGCYAVATVRAFYYKNTGNEGVAFGLSNIMKTRDGESIGGRADAETDFKALVSSVPAQPSASGLEDLFGAK